VIGASAQRQCGGLRAAPPSLSARHARDLYAAGMAGGRRRRTWLVAIPLVMLLPVSCAAPATDAPPPTAIVAPPVTPSADPVPAGQLRITGAVRGPGVLTAQQLAGMTSQTVSVSYRTDRGEERHTAAGIPLFDLVDHAGLVLAQGRDHDELSIGIVVIGLDGYRALISYGEMSPAFGNRGVLLAISADGKPLARPWLVVPGDLRGARYVKDVVELHVVHTAPTW
jgi:hypothetical protein